MFRRKDDDLLNYAFGDMDAKEAQIFEAGLIGDTEAAKQAEFLRDLRSDLQSFRDVPEMQYSKERLREAILGKGLTPAKAPLPWWNFALAPAALASVAALIFVMTQSGPKETVFVASNGQPTFGGTKSEIDLVKDAVKTNQSAMQAAPAGPGVQGASSSDSIRLESNAKDVATKANRSDRRSSKARTNGSDGIVVAAKAGDVSKSKVDELRTDFIVPAITSSPSLDSVPMAAANRSETVVAEPAIVLIDTNVDSGAGAAMATEVANPTNVIIGG